MPWYYANNNQRLGPVSDSEFARLAREKTIREDTLVWQHGMPDWKTYAEIVPNLPPPEIPLAGTNGAPLPSSQEPRPAATFSKSDEGVIRDVMPARFSYAGFWLRFVAKVIDSLILSGIVMVISKAMGIWHDFPPLDSFEQLYQFLDEMKAVARVGLVVGLAYNWFFLRRFSATPGKLMLGIKVVRSDGSALSHGRIIARYFAEMLNRFTLFIGYVIAAFDDEKRAMHDHICDTRVVKKPRE